MGLLGGPGRADADESKTEEREQRPQGTDAGNQARGTGKGGQGVGAVLYEELS